MAWGETTWFPQTLAAGWKYWAIVQSEGAIAKINTEKLVQSYTQAGITAKYFSNADDALIWLESQP
jgi:hypothetical protein